MILHFILGIMILLMTHYLGATVLRPTVEKILFLLAVTWTQPMEPTRLEPWVTDHMGALIWRSLLCTPFHSFKCTCTSTYNAIVFSSLQSIAISIINIMSIKCTYWYVPVKLKLFVYCNTYSNFYYFWLEVT